MSDNDGGSDSTDPTTALLLDPVFLGWTVRELWTYVHHPITCIGWLLLCIAPRWKPTFTIVTLIPPFLYSILYASILLPLMVFPEPNAPVVDIYNMDSIQALFANANIFFCGWIHYLAFDLLVARGIAMDAIQTCHVSYMTYYLLVVPCLFATFFVGPVGYLCYILLRLTRIIIAPPTPTTTSNDTTKKNT